MASRKQKWMLPLLLPNLTVAIVVLIQILWSQHLNARELVHVLRV